MQVEPHFFVIFGATGNLAQRKLLPAYYRLILDRGLGTQAQMLGVGRTAMTDEEFRASIAKALISAGFPEAEADAWCQSCVQYVAAHDGFEAVSSRLAELEKSMAMPGNRIFYLALPPTAFGPAIESLGEAGLARSPGYTRLVVEKPFGRDLEFVLDLNALFHRYFE